MTTQPIDLSAQSALWNYEDERYRQGDPPFSAYEICNAYIPVNSFSERRVELCLKKMLAEYNLDFSGINIREAINNFSSGAALSNAWRQLILEGLNGFLKLRMYPDTINHSGIRRGYVHIILMYLPKRGEIYDEFTEFDQVMSGARAIRRNMPNGTVLGLKLPFTDKAELNDSDNKPTVYIPDKVHYAVVISQNYIENSQSVPVAEAGTASLSSIAINSIDIESQNNTTVKLIKPDNISEEPQCVFYWLRTVLPLKNCGIAKTTDYKDYPEVISVYNLPAIKYYPDIEFQTEIFEVGTLNEAACAMVQQYYNDHKTKAVRSLIDKDGCVFSYDENRRQYFDVHGCALVNPEKYIAAQPRDAEPESSDKDTVKTIEAAYDPANHADDYITLMLIG